MKLPTLYHLGKAGKLYQWQLEVKDHMIYTTYGQVGGRMLTTHKKCKAKNVGKANEVSPQDQAVKEAKAMHKKKLDLKYSDTPEKARLPVFLPMLAHPIEKVKKLTFPLHVQPKLNGVRCLAHWDGDSVRLMSRGGKEYHIPHLQTEIAAFLPKQFVLDGEIYIHGTSLQQIVRLVKKYRPGETDQLQLWVYDLFEMDNPNVPWSKRCEHLAKGFAKCTDPSIVPKESVLFVQNELIRHERDIHVAQMRYVQSGYEGAIVRLFDGVYELGHRSRSLLKVKSFKDDEYRIVGYENGVGKFENCVIWVCETPDGRRFNVVPKGTLDEKRAWLESAEEYVGQMLTVRYFELTEDGIPQFPVGVPGGAP